MSNCIFQQVPGRSIVLGKEANVIRMGDEKAHNEGQGGDRVSVMGGGLPPSRDYLLEKLEPCSGARLAVHLGSSSLPFWRAECFVCFRL